MTVFGNTLSEYIAFQKYLLILTIAAGLIRFGLSLAGDAGRNRSPVQHDGSTPIRHRLLSHSGSPPEVRGVQACLGATRGSTRCRGNDQRCGNRYCSRHRCSQHVQHGGAGRELSRARSNASDRGAHGFRADPLGAGFGHPRHHPESGASASRLVFLKTIDRERAHCSSSHSDTVGTRNRPLREVLSTWLHSRHTDTMRSTRSLYHGHRYPLEILSHAVWLYYKFGLSLRNVEDLLAKRGLVVTYETIRRWCTKFGSEYVRRLKRRQSRLGDNWFLDEVFVTSNGERHYLWRGVDQDGDAPPSIASVASASRQRPFPSSLTSSLRGLGQG